MVIIIPGYGEPVDADEFAKGDVEVIKYIHENEDGSFRAATDEEINKARADARCMNSLRDSISGSNESKLELLRKQCTHPVRYDTVEYAYSTRTCVICGHVSLV